MKRRLFRLPPNEAQAGADVAEEIAYHLERRTEELVRRGESPGAARAQALLEFGDVAAAQEELSEVARRRTRKQRRAAFHEALGQDLRSAVRSLRLDPLFTTAVVLTLALAVSVNAAMFGLTDRLLFRPPPHVRAADEIVRVNHQVRIPGEGVGAIVGYSYPEYETMRASVHAFQSIGAFTTATAPVGHGVEAERAHLLVATASFLPMLGVAPAAGRFFSELEDAPGNPARVVVLSYAYWQRRFAGEHAALGQTIEIRGQQYQIIGVAPAGFRGVELERIDLIVPASTYAAMSLEPDWSTTRRTSWLSVVGRLSSVESLLVATEQATAARRQSEETYGDDPAERALLASLNPRRLPAPLRGVEYSSGRTSALLLGVSLVVLLIACANVANLLLARALRRTRELGIRVALGVSRARLFTLLVSEAALLSLMAGCVGVLLTRWIGALVRTLLLPDVDWSGGVIDTRVLLFAGVLLGCCTVVLTLAPAWQLRGMDLQTALRSGVREGGGRHQRLRRGLVIAQAGLSVVLLVCAGLFVRSLHNVRTIDLGFVADRVLVMTWDERGSNRTREQWTALYDRAVERVRSLPIVSSASLGATVPYQTATSNAIRVPGRDSLPTMRGGAPYVSAISPDYFQTTGTQIISGRAFNMSDVAGAPKAAIVDEAFASVLWPKENALGKCFRVVPRTECVVVVGVVANSMRNSLLSDALPQYFLPIAQSDTRDRALFVRLRDNAENPVDMVRTTVQQIQADLPYANVRLLSDVIEPMVRPWRVSTALILAFGMLALVVALVGLYSLMAYMVASRRQELCVRLALGARRDQVLQLVLGDAARTLLLGLAAGVATALVVAPRIQAFLFEVAPRDPLVVVSVILATFGVGMAAALVPALRGARVNVNAVLRTD